MGDAQDAPTSVSNGCCAACDAKAQRNAQEDIMPATLHVQPWEPLGCAIMDLLGSIQWLKQIACGF